MPYKIFDRRKEAKLLKLLIGNSGLASSLTGALLTPFEAMYAAALRRRNETLEKYGLAAIPAPVISVGNITLGGTGKTPVCLYLAARLNIAGMDVGVATRGYGRKGGKPVSLSKSSRSGDLSNCGDEPVLFIRSPHILAVAVDPDKSLGSMRLAAEFGCKVILLDDGFQFITLDRIANIVLLDAASPFGNGRLLPRGVLREPVSALARATAFWLTRCDAATTEQLDSTRKFISKKFPQTPVIESIHKPAGVRLFCRRMEKHEQLTPLDSIKGKKIATVCAIGSPASFEGHVESLSGKPVLAFRFTDHHAFTEAELMEVEKISLNEGCDCVVTTEKDEARLPSSFSPKLDWLVLPVGIEVTSGQRHVDDIVSAAISWKNKNS